jgi:aubergine-like protein
LCGMTGLTEEHRSGFWFNYFWNNQMIEMFSRNNFKMTQANGNITRVTPGRRVETLMKFRRRLAETPQV